MVAEHTQGLIDNLSKKDRNVVESLVLKMTDNEELTKRVCVYMAGQVGQEEIDHFIKLDFDMQIEACTNYLIIALTSGDMKRKELNIFLN